MQNPQKVIFKCLNPKNLLAVRQHERQFFLSCAKWPRLAIVLKESQFSHCWSVFALSFLVHLFREMGGDQIPSRLTEYKNYDEREREREIAL